MAWSQGSGGVLRGSAPAGSMRHKTGKQLKNIGGKAHMSEVKPWDIICDIWVATAGGGWMMESEHVDALSSQDMWVCDELGAYTKNLCRGFEFCLF